MGAPPLSFHKRNPELPAEQRLKGAREEEDAYDYADADQNKDKPHKAAEAAPPGPGTPAPVALAGLSKAARVLGAALHTRSLPPDLEPRLEGAGPLR